MTRKLDTLVRLSQDRGATHAERALAAEHAARMLSASGIDYLSVYPAGLPTFDDDTDFVDWENEL